MINIVEIVRDPYPQNFKKRRRMLGFFLNSVPYTRRLSFLLYTIVNQIKYRKEDSHGQNKKKNRCSFLPPKFIPYKSLHPISHMNTATLLNKLPLVPAKVKAWRRIRDTSDPDMVNLIDEEIAHQAYQLQRYFKKKLLISLPPPTLIKGKIKQGTPRTHVKHRYLWLI